MATLRFVQDSIRYTGIENGIWGVKPFSPNQVFNLRYGDCKGKSLLLCYMLEKLDIQAYPALVSTSYLDHVNQYPPAPFDFDHCIVNVELNRNQYWYDVTRSLQKGSYDKIYTSNYKAALILKPDNKKLSTMSVNGISRTKVVERYTLEQIGKGANLEVETEYEGYDADVNRNYFQNNSTKEIEKNYLNYYSNSFPYITSQAPPSHEDDESQNLIRTFEKYSNLPEPWNIKDETTNITAPGFLYIRDVKNSGNTLTIRHYVTTTADYIEAKDVAEYNKNITTAKAHTSYTLQYNSGEGYKTGINWPIILIFIMALAGGFYMCWKLYKYDPIPPQGYMQEDSIGGWLILFGIGTCIGPFLLIYHTIKDEALFNNDWLLFFAKGSSVIDPTYLFFNTYVLISDIFLICLSVLLCIVFLKRRSNTTTIMIVFYSFDLFMLISNPILRYLLFIPQPVQGQTYIIVTTSIRAAIWISYFLLADRPKSTFVERLKKGEE